jgi:hypothetical protein
LDYAAYLAKIVELTRKVKNPESGGTYPRSMDTPAKRALYDNLGKNEALAVALHEAVRASKQDDWRSNPVKVKMVRNAIKGVVLQIATGTQEADEEGYRGTVKTEPIPYRAVSEVTIEQVLELVKNQDEY